VAAGDRGDWCAPLTRRRKTAAASPPRGELADGSPPPPQLKVGARLRGPGEGGPLLPSPAPGESGRPRYPRSGGFPPAINPALRGGAPATLRVRYGGFRRPGSKIWERRIWSPAAGKNLEAFRPAADVAVAFPPEALEDRPRGGMRLGLLRLGWRSQRRWRINRGAGMPSSAAVALRAPAIAAGTLVEGVHVRCPANRPAVPGRRSPAGGIRSAQARRPARVRAEPGGPAGLARRVRDRWPPSASPSSSWT
jgi:hypothetical protein